ncbi:MAG: ABC transporter permease [Anaerolineae bacterium]|nr:ABC transporter permease [Anaerolineae bacterium]
MGQYIIRRVLWMLVALFAISVVTFLLMRLVPGGPFNSERGIPEAVKRNLEARYNLNAPLTEQYLDYMGGLVVPRVTDGEWKQSQIEHYLALRWMNFGPSLKSPNRTVTAIVAESLPASVQLGFAAILIALAIGIPIGTIAALRQNTAWDYASMAIAVAGVSVPSIISAPLLKYIFAVNLKILPSSGWGGWEHIILPAFALGFIESALIARLTRASLLQVLREDYIRTARSKGLPERFVIGWHAMKNSLIPVVTVIGPLAAALLTGTFVVETIFGIPGLGRSFVTSIGNRDYPLIMGTVMLFATFVVIGNLLVDITYALLDPRIRYD